MITRFDLLFADTAEGPLHLDLYLPESAPPRPLVMFIHGGAWTMGTRKKCPLAWLTDHGYAVASVDYRFSQQARFPAQIHDCKGAVRWLRAHAAEHGYDAARLVAAGTSAGGHLAVLLGTTAGVPELEGDVGGNLDQPSRVQAVIDYFGPTDFLLRARTQPAKTETPDSPVHRLLGSRPRDNEALARLASGAWHVGPDAAPLLAFHGTADRTVLMDQAERLRDAYREHSREAALYVVPGAGHDHTQFLSADLRRILLDFLGRHLPLPGAKTSTC
jgi:acetyl esterase/lipase